MDTCLCDYNVYWFNKGGYHKVSSAQALCFMVYARSINRVTLAVKVILLLYKIKASNDTKINQEQVGLIESCKEHKK